MHYIFNLNNEIIGWCDFIPDLKDLESRQEYSIYCDEIISDPRKIVVGKYRSIFEPADNPKTKEELTSEQTIKILLERDYKLKETDWMINRQLEQQNLSLTPTLAKQQFICLLNYRQNLRDITKHDMFPFVDLPILNLEV